MSTLERIDSLEKSVEDLAKSTDKLTDSFSQLLGAYQVSIQKLTALEQSITSLAKTLAAVSLVLIKAGTIKSEDVMDQLRQGDDKDQEDRVHSLLKDGVIKAEEVIGEDSLAAVSQKLVDTADGKVTVVSGYAFFSVNHPSVKEELKSKLLGKKVGETIEGKVDGSKTELITVKEIYSVVEKTVVGEPAAQDLVQKEESAPATSENNSVVETTATETTQS
jgi:hypothetical protein